MVIVREVEYQPIGDELNGQVALLQAASVLDAAVYLAVEAKNVDRLMDVVAMWMGLAERLGIESEEDEQSNENKPKSFGFSKVESTIEEVDSEDE